MLSDLRKYDCLGTPNYFFELVNTIRTKGDGWTLSDLEKVFYNKIIDNRPIVDGAFELGFNINIFQLNNSYVSVGKPIENSLNSIGQFIDKFNQLLFDQLKDDQEFYEIFNSKYLRHDIIYRTLQIDNAAFGFRYSNFKQLLIDFEAICQHPTPEFSGFILNQRYKKLFDKTILKEIKKRKIGVEEFKKQMEKQQLDGEKAEKYVLEYENKRLENVKNIDWVAEFIVNEGYDIASFDSVEDMKPNRFIEVKSFEGNPSFHWTQNEMSVARVKKQEYYIYLVDRNKMNESDYKPTMIQDPYSYFILNKASDWNQSVEKIRFQFIG